MKTAWQSGLPLWTWGSIVLLMAASGACANQEGDTLEAGLVLHKGSVLVAEPLVVRVVLRNAGKAGVATPYSSPGALRVAAGLRIEIRKGTETLMTTWARSSGVRLIAPKGGNILPPGGSVSAEKTFCLRTTAADGSSEWLAPGTYQVRAFLQLQGRDGPLETAEQTLRVMPLPPSAEGLLRVVSVDDAWFLEGRHMKPTAKQVERAKELRERFPGLPHRQYYEYQVLRGLNRNDLATYRPAALAYLKDFPKSPYCDDILWWLGRMEIQVDEIRVAEDDRALGRFEALLKEHPDSPFKQEAEETLPKWRELKRISKEKHPSRAH